MYMGVGIGLPRCEYKSDTRLPRSSQPSTILVLACELRSVLPTAVNFDLGSLDLSTLHTEDKLENTLHFKALTYLTPRHHALFSIPL